MKYQLLIKNAQVIDGTGTAPYQKDIAVLSGKILTDPDPECPAEEVIDASGLALVPGFIDAHCHEDETLGNEASTLSKLSQGITTVSCGNCGESYFPVPKDPGRLAIMKQAKAEYLAAPDCGYKDIFDTFTSFSAYRKYIENRPTAYNYTMMTGHGTLRISVMGMDNRKPTDREMDEMKALLRESMEHGSRGLSTGLIYAPECYADEEEITELCKVVAEYDGYYAVHLRNEGGEFVEAVEEAIRTARNAGCRLNLSHHKTCGKENWGKTVTTLQMIEDAAKDGMFIFTDVYPYLATGNYINICLPKEFFENGQEKMQELLRDPAVRAEMKEAILHWKESRYNNCGGFENIVVCNAPASPQAVGKSIAEYARFLGKDEFETYFDLCSENGVAGQAAYFAMSEEDLERILMDDNAVICTDSYDIGPANAVHPRSFGSFPLCLSRYVRERKLMSAEQMIHRMTGRTAAFMNLPQKGLIRDGYDADLLLFDPETIAPAADFAHSRALSKGILRVLVSGETVYENYRMTEKKPGRFIAYR